jgi:thiamine biosynthesis lipoprotein ApbE
MNTDALDITLFVFGEKVGLKFIEGFPGAAALFLLRQTDGKFKAIPSTKFSAMTGYQP